MHDLLQFLNIAESMATLTAWLSAFGLLVDDGKSICGEGSMRSKFVNLSTWELTIVYFIDLYIGPLEKIHQHVWLGRLH